MYNLPGNIYTFAILLLFQGFLVLLVVYFFIDKFFSSRRQRLESNLINQEAYSLALKELDSAKIQALDTIKTAQDTAAKIISSAEYLSNDVKKNLTEGMKSLVRRQDAEIAKVIADFSSDLKFEFNREKITTLAAFDAMYQELKQESVSQIKSYKDILAKNSLDAESFLKVEADKMLVALKSNIASYEQTQLEKIRNRAFNVLCQISQDFLGQTLTVSDHEDLVIKLFEEAKLKETLGL